MKLVTFETEQALHIGSVLPGEATVSDFTAASNAAYFRDMLSLIDGGAEALDHARALDSAPKRERALSDVRLKAPVPVPRQMFDCLLFEEHIVNCGRNAHLAHGGPPLTVLPDAAPPIYGELPIYYKCNRFSVIGPDDDIVRPRYSHWLDYELEFGVFLSRSGKNLSVQEAADHIFGYCIFNDVSARDQQMREMRGNLGPSKGKDFDTGNVLGPWLVTPDEIPKPNDLTMNAYLNGTLVSSGNSGGMLHSFAEIIAYSTQDETRHAGEFFGSGTVGGGSGLERGVPLAHGDVIELEVTGLGRLRNRVVFQESGA